MADQMQEHMAVNGWRAISLLVAASLLMCLPAAGLANPGVAEDTWKAYQDALSVAAEARNALPIFAHEDPCPNLSESDSNAVLKDYLATTGEYLRDLEKHREQVEEWRVTVMKPFNKGTIADFQAFVEGKRMQADARLKEVDQAYSSLPPNEEYEQEMVWYNGEMAAYRCGIGQLYPLLGKEYDELVASYREEIALYRKRNAHARELQEKIGTYLTY